MPDPGMVPRTDEVPLAWGEMGRISGSKPIGIIDTLWQCISKSKVEEDMIGGALR